MRMKKYSEYKPSGIPWLKDIPAHWDVRYLFQVAGEHFISNQDVHHQNLLSLSYGRLIRKDINTSEGLLPASFDDYQVVEPGNVILRFTDLQNDHKSLRVGLAKEEGIITSAYVCLNTTSDSVVPDYLYNNLHTYDLLKVFYSMGGGIRQSLNYAGIRKLPVLVPPLSEQIKIITYLEKKVADIDSIIVNKQLQLDLIKESIEHYIYCGNTSDSYTIRSWQKAFPSEWIMLSGKQLFVERNVKNLENERFLASTQNKGIVYKDECEANYVTASDPKTQKLVCENDFVISLRSFQGGIEFSRVRGIISAAYVVMHLREQFDSPELRNYYRFLLKSRPYVELLGSLSDSLRDGKSIKYSEFGQFYYPVPDDDIL